MSAAAASSSAGLPARVVVPNPQVPRVVVPKPQARRAGVPSPVRAERSVRVVVPKP